MPLDPLDLAAVGGDLTRLAELLRSARIQLPGATKRQFQSERDEVLLTIDGYLEPRIGAPDAPIVAAIVGPSGVGKSTILNSIAQQRVTPTSVVRPTTERPMVWADASHPDEYWQDFSKRVEAHLGQRVDARLGEDAMTDHLTIIDTPPLDRFGPDEVAAQAVVLADLCVFVTTPTRYADGIAWSFLRRARRRGIPILFVVNRLPRDLTKQETILDDFARRLYGRGLLTEADASLLFGLVDDEIDPRTEALQPDAVSAIRKELAEVADPIYRSGLVDETVYATARMVAERARSLTRPMAAEQKAVAQLMEVVTRAYETEASALDSLIRAGVVRSIGDRVDWLGAAEDVASVVTRRAGAAAHTAASDWSRRPESAELVEFEGLELWRHGATTAKASRQALDGWRAGLEDLATTHARPGRLRWFGAKDRAVAALWRAVLGGDRELPQRVGKKFTDSGQEILATARAELSEALRAGLAVDAERFTRYLNGDGEADLYESIVDRADSVDARLDELAVQVPGAWSESHDAIEVVQGNADDVVSIHIEEGEAIVELGGSAEIYHRIEALHPTGREVSHDAGVAAEDGK